MAIINGDIDRVLVSEQKIDGIVRRIAAEIDDDYKDDEAKLVLLGILKGSVVFMGELMKRITSVSYTHLDVYKRQQKNGGICTQSDYYVY